MPETYAPNTMFADSADGAPTMMLWGFAAAVVALGSVNVVSVEETVLMVSATTDCVMRDNTVTAAPAPT